MLNRVISNDNKAKLLMIISAFSFSIMAAFVKATSHSVAVKAFSRQIFSCIFVLAIIFINKDRIIPLKKSRIKLILRCLFGTVGMYLYFYSNFDSHKCWKIDPSINEFWAGARAPSQSVEKTDIPTKTSK